MLIIFDWDGTLIDSAGKIINCMQMAANDVELPQLTADEVKNIIGLGLPEAIRTLYPGIDDASVQLLRETYSNHFVREDQVPCEFFPSVMPTLQALRDDGHALAVATGKSRKGLNRVLANLQLEGFFDSTRCADETQSKPHPLMLQEILQELDVHPDDAVMVGDTEYDLAMASNAGVRSIAVTYGAHSSERLQKHEPCLWLENFATLLEWSRR